MIGGKLTDGEKKAFANARDEAERRAIIQGANDRRLDEKGMEKPPSPVKDKPPVPVKEKLPTPVKEKPPAPVKDKPPASAKEKAPAPVKEKPPAAKPKKYGNGDHDSSPDKDDPRSAIDYAKQVGITPAQARARFKAVKSFTGDNSYSKVRADQRAGRKNKQADLIEDFIKSSTPYKGTIERGIALRPGQTMDGLRKRLTTGTGAIASWTSDPFISEMYAQKHMMLGRENVVILRAKNKSGASVRNLSEYTGENEVTVGKGAKYRITKEGQRTISYGPMSTTATVIELEEI